MASLNYYTLGCSLTVPLSDRRILRSRAYSEAAQKAGAVVLDLEDSVPEGAKAEARGFLGEAFDHFFTLNKNIFCRINGGTEFLYPDLQACAQKPLAGLQLPKVSSSQDIMNVQTGLKELKISNFDLVPIIETLDAIKNIEDILKIHRPPCLYFGPEDMSCQLGVEPSAESLWYVAHKLLFEAARLQIPVFGLLGPLCYSSRPYLKKFKDLLDLSKKVGFQGAPAIHPQQVEVILECFRVTKGEQALLSKLTECEQKHAVFSVEGLMYGPPMIKRLRKRVSRS